MNSLHGPELHSELCHLSTESLLESPLKFSNLHISSCKNLIKRFLNDWRVKWNHRALSFLYICLINNRTFCWVLMVENFPNFLCMYEVLTMSFTYSRCSVNTCWICILNDLCGAESASMNLGLPTSVWLELGAWHRTQTELPIKAQREKNQKDHVRN